MTSFGHRMCLLCCLVFAVSALSETVPDDQVVNIFENRYQAWKTWVSEHSYLSTYTTSEEFQSIVAIGPSAVPLLIAKIEQNPDDFHLEVAIHRITKRRFDKGEWSHGKLGDAKTAAGMYVKWWKEGRFKTGERFADLYDKWKSLRLEKKDKEAQDVYQQIVDLGIPVLPYLVDKVEQQTEFVPAISILSGGALANKATAAECKNWWKNNKKRFESLTQSSNGGEEHKE